MRSGEEPLSEAEDLMIPQVKTAGKLMAGSSFQSYGEIAYDHVDYLSNEIGARPADNLTGSAVPEGDPEVLTQQYIAEEFSDLGFTVETQPFSFTSRGKSYDSANIIAVKPGISSKVVIVGAHYDSVSPKPILLTPPAEKTVLEEVYSEEVYQEKTVTEAVYMYGKGADDNASGVAIMLEADQRLAGIETPYTNQICGLWRGGERFKGLKSLYFTDDGR